MRDYRYSIFTSAIEAKITKGILKPGSKLPSVRSIKKEYNLSTSSVQSGYDYLVFKGLVTSIPRSGYVVAALTKVNEVSEIDLAPIARDPKFKENIVLTSVKQRAVFASLNAATPADFFVPQKLVLRTMQQVIREKGAALLRYYPTNGTDELRELLAKRLAGHGAQVQPEELLITDGALQALYIALAVTTAPNDIIAVESPCVFSVLEVIANLGLKIIEIPVRCNEGFDTDYLKSVCSKNAVKAIVLTPNFHNPTGILMTDERKKEVLAIALHHNIPIIENDIYGDLYFHHSRPSNIRNFDTSGSVITFSSFSKTIAPGIRLGWMAPGRFFSKAERMKFSLGRSVSPMNQEIITKLLGTSGYDRHLRIFRHHLKRQASQLAVQFSTYYPESTCIQVPQGGYSIWGKLPVNTDMQEFYKTCDAFGIHFTPGTTFSLTDAYDHCFRAIFSQHITPASLEAIKTIGLSLNP